MARPKTEKKQATNRLKSMPKCPPHIKGYAADFWKKHGSLLVKSGHLIENDLPTFEILAATYSLWKQAQEKLDSGDLTSIAKSGYEQVSPWVTISTRARADYLKYCRKFGLSPYDRGGLDVDESDDGDAFNEF